MDKILVTRSSMPPIEEYIEEIKSLWDSHWLTNMGEKHCRLEKALANYLDTDNITLFTNGHLALENIIAAFDMSGEVITTPFTFVSTTHAIVRNGLTPVFCDISPEDCTIDVSKIEALITDKTCAIVPVHVYGNICGIEAIDRIAKEHGLKVIYDAAHAFGVRKNGVSVANFGDASMFSFHATKVFNTIEGGAVTFKDLTLAKRLNDQKNFGMSGSDTVDFIGGNAKMNEFQAAMGLCNLRHLEQNIADRKRVVGKYLECLSNIDSIIIPRQGKDITPNYAYFPIIFDGYKYSRDEVFEKLACENIFARKYFYPLVTDFACYNKKYDSSMTPVAKHIAECVLTLPLYPDLALDDVERICDIILL